MAMGLMNNQSCMSSLIAPLIGLAGVIVGAFLRPVVDRVVIWLNGPNLRLSADNCPTQTAGGAKQYYLRVAVENTGRLMARQCRVFLSEVEVWKVDRFTKTDYRDCLPLIWSYDSALVSTDIPFGVTRHADIAVFDPALQPGLRLQFWSGKSDPLDIPQFQSFTSLNGKFRFTIIAGVDGASAKKERVIVEWDGQRLVVEG